MYRGLTIAVGVLMLSVGCGDDGPSSSVEPTLESIQNEVFAESCGYTGCHGAIQAAANLDLSSAERSYDSLVDAPAATTENPRTLVVPFSPEESYLLNKLRGEGVESNQDFPLTDPMPAIGGSLPKQAIEAIETWIVDGCPL